MNESLEELHTVLKGVHSQATLCVSECEDQHAQMGLMKIEAEYLQKDTEQVRGRQLVPAHHTPSG